MKYHSLKMEEVNDTMRHLWNKTYQGTGVCPTARCPEDTDHVYHLQTSTVSKLVPIVKEVQLNGRTITGLVPQRLFNPMKCYSLVSL